MKYIKLYEEYTSKPDHPGFFKTYEETKNWLDEMGLENYTIKDDLSVDVDGNVELYNKNLKYIPVKFSRVSIHFNCSNNQLTNLIGSPSYVGGKYNCENNQLTSLEGSPSEHGGYFTCSNNQLTSLTGGPIKVGWDFNCSENYLTSLQGAPKIVGWYFNNIDNYLTIDEPYIIDFDNPGYEEKRLPKVTQNFLYKLENSELDSTTQLRILDSLKDNKPQVYAELGKLVDLDDWLSRLTNSKTHIDIMNL